MRLLTTGNPKTAKGRKYGYHTGVLHLYPSRHVCPQASLGCFAACLNTAGRAGIVKAGETTNRILECRKGRTRYLKRDPVGFRSDLDKDIVLLRRQAGKARLKTAVRLNGTSDLTWDEIIRGHSVMFYDYTKRIDRMADFLMKRLPENYHLTYSRTENNWARCQSVLMAGGNVAVVTMTGDKLAAREHLEHNGLVEDGNEHDLTFLHHPGSILVLKAKGRARKDTTGFVLPC